MCLGQNVMIWIIQHNLIMGFGSILLSTSFTKSLFIIFFPGAFHKRGKIANFCMN